MGTTAEALKHDEAHPDYQGSLINLPSLNVAETTSGPLSLSGETMLSPYCCPELMCM